MYNIHVKKYSSFALRSPFFFFPFFCSGWSNSHLCVTGSWMAVGKKRALSCFNSYHIHRGICIEGTSMHLNCLHDQWKAVLSSGKKTKTAKYPRKEGSHITNITSPHTRRHKQTLHKTKYKLICLTIKLHTVHHTTEDLITQSEDGVHPGGGESVQRTLAVKQHPPVGGSSSQKKKWKEKTKHWFHDF